MGLLQHYFYLFFLLYQIEKISNLIFHKIIPRNSLDLISDFVQKRSMVNIIYTKNIKTQIENINSLNYTSPNIDLKYPVVLNDYNETILKDSEKIKNNSKNLENEIYNNENMRFRLEISVLFFLCFLTISGLIGKIYIFLKKAYKKSKKNIVVVFSLLIYLLIIPIFVILGKNFSFFVFSIDLCKEVMNIVQKEVEPKQEKGVGFYLACPAKNTRKAIYTNKYLLSTKIDILINDLNNTFKQVDPKGLGMYKRNNTNFDFLSENAYNYTEKNKTIQKGLKSLIEFNGILEGLESLSKCEYALSSINYMEENFCRESLDYQFNGIFFLGIGSFGILLLSIGLNKLSVLVDEVTEKKVILLFLYFRLFINICSKV